MDFTMQNFFKKCFVFLAIIMCVAAPVIPAYADENTPASTTTTDVRNQIETKVPNTESTSSVDCRTFLGLNSWDCGIKTNPDNEEDLKSNAQIISSNILDIIVGLIAYFFIGYVIYGGYLYIFSSGDPTKVAASKRTLTNACIGLLIAACAKIIFSSIGIALISNGDPNAFQGCSEQDCTSSGFGLVSNLIGWVIGIAGVVSAAYVVTGGIGYVTSAGDPNKLQKSKNTIIYALIGLIVVALSLSIKDFAINIANNAAANGDGDISGPLITLLNTVIGFSSIVSVGFIIKGGIDYMTSSGDPTKVKKAKDTILYACIGLIVCVLSFAIVNWAIGITPNSATNPNNNEVVEQS